MEQRSIEVEYEIPGREPVTVNIEMDIQWLKEDGAFYAECDDLSLDIGGVTVPYNFRRRLWDAHSFGVINNEHFTNFIQKSVDEYTETAER